MSKRKTEDLEVVAEKMQSMTIAPAQTERELGVMTAETKPASESATGMYYNCVRRVHVPVGCTKTTMRVNSIVYNWVVSQCVGFQDLTELALNVIVLQLNLIMFLP